MRVLWLVVYCYPSSIDQFYVFFIFVLHLEIYDEIINEKLVENRTFHDLVRVIQSACLWIS
jgi:hypothetical protein